MNVKHEESKNNIVQLHRYSISTSVGYLVEDPGVFSIKIILRYIFNFKMMVNKLNLNSY
jgi:hypothetical protein